MYGQSTMILLWIGIITAGLFFARSFLQKRPRLSHIPILGPELGRAARKAELRKNARTFLQRGYREVNRSQNSRFLLVTDTLGPVQQGWQAVSGRDH